MTLFKLALNNIKKNFKNYAIYFFTLAFGVALFYAFNSLDTSLVMLDFLVNPNITINSLTEMMETLTVFISIVLSFIIIYSSKFIISRRKQELGMYLLLGMRKSTLAIMLMIESFIIGVIALIVGLIIGIIGAQFLTILLGNMFHGDINQYQFMLSMNGIKLTLMCFSVIYIITITFNILMVNFGRLITIINRKSKIKRFKLNSIIILIMLLIVSIVLLTCVYFGINELLLLFSYDRFIYIMFYIIVGTFLLGYSLLGIVLYMIRTNNKFYLKTINIFKLNQIYNKLYSNIISMGIISVIMFISIFLLSIACSMHIYQYNRLDTLNPVDFNVFYDNRVLDFKTDELVLIDNDLYTNNNEEYIDNKKLLDKINNDIFNINDISNDYILTTIKAYEKFTYGDLIFDYLPEDEIYDTSDGRDYELYYYSNEFSYITSDREVSLISLSEYNELAKSYKLELVQLKDNEYVIVLNNDSLKQYYELLIDDNYEIKLFNDTFKPANNNLVYGFIGIDYYECNDGLVVLPDQFFKDNLIKFERTLISGNYSNNDKDNNAYGLLKLYDYIEFDEVEQKLTFNTGSRTKSENYDSSNFLYENVSLVFASLYISIIFLICSGVILAIKELTSYSENKERFIVLTKLGASKNSLENTHLLQVSMFFVLPLLLAIINVIIAVNIMDNYDYIQYINEISTGMFMAILLTLIVYGTYFMITYRCSKNMIDED